MPATKPDNLTLLIRPGESSPRLTDAPMMPRVSDPGPSFLRLRSFFRPWRLFGKALVIGLPCLAAAGVIGLGGWVSGSASWSSTATTLTWLPLGILALWAGLAGVFDLSGFGRHRKKSRAYKDAMARLGAPDILTPADLRSPGIREGLRTLGLFERLLAGVDSEGARVGSLLRDSLYETKRMVFRSVLDLIATERRLMEWSGRLGEDSAYKAKLEARRAKLTASYPGILDECLQAMDQALAKADAEPGDLEQSVQGLLDSCHRALDEVDRDGPAVDEQELLMYAAKARDRAAHEAEAGEADAGLGLAEGGENGGENGGEKAGG